MTLVEEFRSAVDLTGRERVDAPELLPTVLSQACVEVLPVDGAGLSVIRALGSPRALRVPLGASDEMAARVERLQTTLGEGPCLAAADQGEPLTFDADGMASRWPVFHAELILQTSIRSIVSLPVWWGDPAEPVAALDLYLVDPDPVPSLEHRGDIVEIIAEMLFASTATVERRGAWLPMWMTGQLAAQRMNVWVAVGILIGHAGLSSTDALAVLRAYAFGHGVTLDDVAEEMTTRRLDPETVLGFN